MKYVEFPNLLALIMLISCLIHTPWGEDGLSNPHPLYATELQEHEE